MDARIRFAGPQDSDALVELRVSMFGDMGQDLAGAWRPAAKAWFERELGGPHVLITVADAPGNGPVSSAMAVLERRAPSPSNPSGSAAHVSQVSTLVAHRRRGYAGACLRALLAELDARGVGRIDLFATGDGDSLYRSLGFRTAPYPALRRP